MLAGSVGMLGRADKEPSPHLNEQLRKDHIRQRPLPFCPVPHIKSELVDARVQSLQKGIQGRTGPESPSAGKRAHHRSLAECTSAKLYVNLQTMKPRNKILRAAKQALHFCTTGC